MVLNSSNSLLLLILVILTLKVNSFNTRGDYRKENGISLRTHPFSKENEEFEDENETLNQDIKDDHDAGIKKLLEDRYKFKNDNVSRRFKISGDERSHTVFPQSATDQHLAMVFRSYAVRRIIGGMETSISMYPYIVSIARNNKHWCGGSVIDEQWVITAGHCVEQAFDGDRKKLSPFVIRAGSSFHNRGGYQARVNKVFFPSDFTPGNADYDFALLRLDRPLPIGRNIAVLNLPATDYLVNPDDLLIVTGWGSTDITGYGRIPDRIRFVPVPVMKQEDCQKAYQFYITPRMLCAGYATGGKDACNHDSGGPAVRDGVLLGIVSWGGKHCGDPRSPGVYSRVTEITDWVEETVTENEAYTVPELREKIRKARQRERELQKFKSRVEDKKNKIKNWLRETLKSPTFLRLAKKKLKEAGLYTRRSIFDFQDESYLMDDRTMDEINLSNLISERLLGDHDDNEAEILLTTLALKEVMLNDGGNEEIIPVYRNREANDEMLETLLAYAGQ